MTQVNEVNEHMVKCAQYKRRYRTLDKLLGRMLERLTKYEPNAKLEFNTEDLREFPVRKKGKENDYKKKRQSVNF